MRRISREELFMEIAGLVAMRSTCERAQVGAVVVKDKRIVATGYGGAPSGQPHCTEVGCEIGPGGGCIRTTHAEANIIAFAARNGLQLEGCDMYVTLSPCYTCAKLIINAGIRTVIYRDEYREDSGLKLLRKAGVKVWFYPQLMEEVGEFLI